MPPAPHRHSSFSDGSDRYSDGDPASADGVDGHHGRPPATPAHFPPPPRRNQHRIQVPRSTHKEIESKRVRRVSDSLPGFSDWRGGGGGGGGGDQLGESGRSGSSSGGDGRVRDDRSSHSHSSRSRRKQPSHRRRGGGRSRAGRPSSFHSGHSGHSSGASENRNIRDIESDVLSRGVSPAPPSRSRSRSRRARAPRRHPNPSDDADESVPSMMSIATEETDKFNNTTTATMLKYKMLYETMLADAERKPSDAAWVGLGDIREENTARSRSGGSVKTKDSFCSADDGNGNVNDNDNRSNDAPWIRHAPPGRGPSFLSEVAPVKQRSILLDSVISGLRVEEVLLDHHAGVVAQDDPAGDHDDDGGGAESAFFPIDDGDADVDVRENDASRERDDASLVLDHGSKPFGGRKTRGDGRDAPGRTRRNDLEESSPVLFPDEDVDVDVEEIGTSYQHNDASYEGGLVGKGRDPKSEPSRSKNKRGDGVDASGQTKRSDFDESAPDEGAGVDVEDIVASRRHNATSYGSDLVANLKLEPTRSKKKLEDHRPGGRGRSDDGPGGGRGATRPERKPERKPERGPRREKHRAPSRGRSRDRSRSPSVSPSVGSQRSGRSGGSRRGGFGVPRIISRSISRGRSSSRPRNADDDPEPQTRAAGADEAWNAAGRPKKGFFRRVKKLAGKVKTSLGVTGVHKFRVGEQARYRVPKTPRSMEGYDEETRTVEAEILLVHIDAVLDTPYYTIRLPNGARKQTNWDKLIPLHEWDKMKADGEGRGHHKDPYSEPASRSRRERSSSRHNGRRRSYVQADDDDDRSARSGASHRSARSVSSHRSERSERSARSNRSSSLRGPGPRDNRRRDCDRRSGRDRSRSKARSSWPRPREGSSSPSRGGGGGRRPGVGRRPSGRSSRR